MYICMRIHWQQTRGWRGLKTTIWLRSGKFCKSRASHFHASKRRLTLRALFNTGFWAWVTHSFACVRHILVYFFFQSVLPASYILLWQLTVQSFIFSRKQTGAGAGGELKQNTFNDVSLLSKRTLSCHINNAASQGQSFIDSRAMWIYEKGAHSWTIKCVGAGAGPGKLLHDEYLGWKKHFHIHYYLAFLV